MPLDLRLPLLLPLCSLPPEIAGGIDAIPPRMGFGKSPHGEPRVLLGVKTLDVREAAHFGGGLCTGDTCVGAAVLEGFGAFAFVSV